MADDDARPENEPDATAEDADADPDAEDDEADDGDQDFLGELDTMAGSACSWASCQHCGRCY